MKLRICIFLLVLYSFPSFSQTEISGSITEDVTWTLEGSPYIIKSNTVVEKNTTLTIEPGVVIKANYVYEFKVVGEIKAVGTPDNNILFTSNTESGNWQNEWYGLWLDNTSGTYDSALNYVSGSLIKYCIFEHASFGILLVNNASVVIKNSEFRLNSSGIYMEESKKVLIDSSKFTNNIGGGCYIQSADSTVIANSFFDQNHTGLALNAFRNSIVFNNLITNNKTGAGFSDVLTNTVFRNNIIQNNEIGIIEAATFHTKNLKIYENIISENTKTGIRLLEDDIENLEIYGNIIDNNPTGIEIYNWESMDYNPLSNNIWIYENQISNSSEAGISNLLNHTPNFVIRNNTLFNNNITFKYIPRPNGNFPFEIPATVVDNNFFVDKNTSFGVKNISSENIELAHNYWGITDTADFADKIYDFHDDPDYGVIHYDSVLRVPLTTNPISGPQHIMKGLKEGGLTVYWNPNKEADLAGYKLYYGPKNGLSYENFIDVGLDTSYVIQELLVADTLVITAYDQEADGENDLFEGHESWYSLPIKSYFTATLISPQSVCPEDSIQLTVRENYSFSQDNLFLLQLSDVNGSFENAVNLDTIYSSTELLQTKLPDTLQHESVYEIRVLSTELQVFTYPVEIIYNTKPSSAFLLAEERCHADTVMITYNSALSDNLELIWSLDEAEIIENKDDSQLWLRWPTIGEKNITLSASRNGCTTFSRQTIKIKKTPTADVEIASFFCEGDTAVVNYLGDAPDTAMYIWNFNDGEIISGKGKGPYKILWDTIGVKNISLQVSEAQCSTEVVTKTIEYNFYPVLAFEAATSICFDEDYPIAYTGTSEGEMNWNFDGADIISGAGAGPYALTWESDGEKAIHFSIDHQTCKRDTIIHVTVAPEALTPSICMVTVDKETSKNKLIWSNNLETIKQFGIYRETNVANDYTLVTYVDAALTMSYIDHQSVPEQISNRYRITAVDTCGVETDMSTIHKTIHLTINKGLEDSWNLIWDSYEGISFGTYRIYRGTSNEDMELLTEIASNLTSYTDLNPPSGNIAYQIEILNPNNCEADANGRVKNVSTSRSNIAKRSSVVTGLDDFIKIDSLLLYPNPTSDKVHISFDNFQEGDYTVYTLYGKQVKKGFIHKEMDIDLTEQPKGVYLLQINVKGGVMLKKLIKE